MARTSTHDLLFTMPDDAYPFERAVIVRWEAHVFEFRLEVRGALLVSADRCFAPNARVVLDAFLMQLAGVEAPPEPPHPA